MYVIGLTGGVGSGKSLVAEKMKELYDAELLIADQLGHIVMQSGTEGFQEVVDYCGQEIVGEDGEIDRSKLAECVFQDKKALVAINKIVHPRVKQYLADYIQKRKEESGIIILETAIMYETGCDSFCDEIWYVYVPEEVRIERLAENRGYSIEKSKSIIEKQLPDVYFIEKANRVIRNDGTIEQLQELLEKEKINSGF